MPPRKKPDINIVAPTVPTPIAPISSQLLPPTVLNQPSSINNTPNQAPSSPPTLPITSPPNPPPPNLQPPNPQPSQSLLSSTNTVNKNNLLLSSLSSSAFLSVLPTPTLYMLSTGHIIRSQQQPWARHWIKLKQLYQSNGTNNNNNYLYPLEKVSSRPLAVSSLLLTDSNQQALQASLPFHRQSIEYLVQYLQLIQLVPPKTSQLIFPIRSNIDVKYVMEKEYAKWVKNVVENDHGIVVNGDINSNNPNNPNSPNYTNYAHNNNNPNNPNNSNNPNNPNNPNDPNDPNPQNIDPFFDTNPQPNPQSIPSQPLTDLIIKQLLIIGSLLKLQDLRIRLMMGLAIRLLQKTANEWQQYYGLDGNEMEDNDNHNSDINHISPNNSLTTNQPVISNNYNSNNNNNQIPTFYPYYPYGSDSKDKQEWKDKMMPIIIEKLKNIGE